jgi:iron complex transport system ATP-binding protein
MSALDIGRQVDLLRIMEKLVDDGKTIILTTHNPNHALAVEGKSCFLKQGTIVAYGNSRDVIQESMLQEVYGKNITLDKGGAFDCVVFNMSD